MCKFDNGDIVIFKTLAGETKIGELRSGVEIPGMGIYKKNTFYDITCPNIDDYDLTTTNDYDHTKHDHTTYFDIPENDIQLYYEYKRKQQIDIILKDEIDV